MTIIRRFTSLSRLQRLAILAGISVIALGAGQLAHRARAQDNDEPPERYSVYVNWQADRGDFDYYLVGVDGNVEQLGWADGGIKRLTCSPDGNTFAFLTNDWQLYVAHDDGIVYQQALEPSVYYGLTVANDGTVIQFDQRYTADGSRPLVRPDFASHNIPFGFDIVNMTSSGASVWSNSDQRGVALVAPTGEILMISPFGYGVRISQSERFFTYTEIYPPGMKQGPGSFLVDVSNGQRVQIPSAVSGLLPFRHPANPVIEHRELQFFECNLSFRPQMLLADNP